MPKKLFIGSLVILISILGVSLNVLLNLILIPRYTVVGAAFASLATQLTMGVLQSILSCRVFSVKVSLKGALQLALFVLFSIGASLIIVHKANSWILGFVIIIVSVAIISFTMRVVRIKEIFLLLVGFEK